MQTEGLGKLSLFPEARLTGELKYIPVDAITPSENIPGARPGAAFLASVERFGVLSPILVSLAHEENPPLYDILFGRRRLLAAREIGIFAIPALIFPKGTAPAEAITIIENAQRSENPVIELTALLALIHDGKNEAEIYRSTGLLPQTQRKRLTLTKLKTELMEALSSGAMALTTAEAAAKLSAVNQARLIRILQESGKVSGRDVHLCSRIAAQEAAAILPGSLFDTPEDTGADMPEGDPFDDSTPGKSAPPYKLIVEQMEDAAESSFDDEAAGIRADSYSRGVYAALSWILGKTEAPPMNPDSEEWPGHEEEDSEVGAALDAGEALAEQRAAAYHEGREMNPATGADYEINKYNDPYFLEDSEELAHPDDT